MVRIGLQICATLENVDKIETCHPDYTFCVKITCTNCGESTEKWHTITESERVQHDTRNPDGFNFYIKCRLCGRESTIDIEKKSNEPYTADDAGKFKTIVVFDCRGVEPIDFLPRIGWIVSSANNGQTFDNVDLSENDWVEYDTKNKTPVGVYEFQSQFVKIKK